MHHLPRAIFGSARVFAPVLHHNVAYVDVRYDITVHRHVLSNDESCVTINEFLFFQNLRLNLNVREIHILLLRCFSREEKFRHIELTISLSQQSEYNSVKLLRT